MSHLALLLCYKNLIYYFIKNRIFEVVEYIYYYCKHNDFSVRYNSVSLNIMEGGIVMYYLNVPEMEVNNSWGEWEERNRIFKGTLRELVKALDDADWLVKAGTTSNQCKWYKIYGIAVTSDNHIVPVIYDGRFMSPVLVNEEMVAIGNYGTPVASDKIFGAIKRWNTQYAVVTEWGPKPFVKVVNKDDFYEYEEECI